MQPQELAAQIDGVQVVDVREPNEWQAGRIAGAVHIPLGQLEGREEELARIGPVVAVCRSGSRSERAAGHLRALGFEAENLDGGMLAWFDAGLPVTTADGRPGAVVEPAQPGNGDPMADPGFQAAFVELALEIQEHFGDHEPSEEEVQAYLRNRMVAEGLSPEAADEVLARISKG